jgi:hypothetical protein
MRSIFFCLAEILDKSFFYFLLCAASDSGTFLNPLERRGGKKPVGRAGILRSGAGIESTNNLLEMALFKNTFVPIKDTVWKE